MASFYSMMEARAEAPRFGIIISKLISKESNYKSGYERYTAVPLSSLGLKGEKPGMFVINITNSKDVVVLSDDEFVLFVDFVGLDVINGVFFKRYIPDDILVTYPYIWYHDSRVHEIDSKCSVSNPYFGGLDFFIEGYHLYVVSIFSVYILFVFVDEVTGDVVASIGAGKVEGSREVVEMFKSKYNMVDWG